MKLFKGLAIASHLGPTLFMTSIGFIFAFKFLPLAHTVGVSLTVLTGQLLTGWSNDYVDRDKDSTIGRSSKPLVSGLITSEQLRLAIVVDTLALLLLTATGTMGLKGGALHLLAVGSALCYNIFLKQSVFSPLPYLLSFAILPVAILSAASQLVPGWAPIVGGLFGCGLHFSNVIADIAGDRELGVRGLPQIVGVLASKLITSTAFISAGAVLSMNVNTQLPLFLGLFALGIFLPIPKQALFPLTMVIGLGELLVLVRYS